MAPAVVENDGGTQGTLKCPLKIAENGRKLEHAANF